MNQVVLGPKVPAAVIGPSREWLFCPRYTELDGQV